MLDLLSCMNDKDKQQVCGNVDCKNNHGWGCPKNQPIVYKITMRIIQLNRNIQRENIIFYFGLK